MKISEYFRDIKQFIVSHSVIIVMHRICAFFCIKYKLISFTDLSSLSEYSVKKKFLDIRIIKKFREFGGSPVCT